MNDTDKQVAAYLQEIGVEYKAYHLGESKEKDWEHDAWRCCFNNEGFEFKTGLGHRAPPTGWAAENIKQKYGRFAKTSKEWKDACTLMKPEAASVLQCLLSDAQASRESFEEWCSNFGYDTDSREALGTYLACQETHIRLLKLFKTAQLVHLENLLEDY